MCFDQLAVQDWMQLATLEVISATGHFSAWNLV